ncbi:MAG: KpsF/GutQ family sugar-phosphate isomerase [Betaproteobacteria bacterium]|nr:KpsF/GutQ family sugar-phosphate isomerase [Betaproteobacteria bacterium]
MDAEKRAQSTALTLARDVLLIEAAAITALASRLDERFLAAVNIILRCKGRVAVSGVGKSGHIARKIASTFASTGTSAFFLHPSEASHGDLGMVDAGDVVIAVSYSGESDEVVRILPALKRLGVTIIAFTGGATSTIAREADVTLDISVAKEACPLNLAPTASTTVTLALGDALAIALLDARGFGSDDFARSHPGGALGRKLLVRVADLMRTGNALPAVRDDATFAAAVLEMSNKGMGMTAVLDQSGSVIGIFTDGDLRRALERGLDLKTTPLKSLMSKAPLTIDPHSLAADAVRIMETHRITALLVTDNEHRLAGATHIHDMLRAKIY